MSTNEHKSVDFSRKCRDRVNFFFGELKSTLCSFPRYSNCHEWSRFDILERATEALELRRGVVNGKRDQAPVDKSNLSNKELCQLYRTRLNTGFYTLRNELDKCENVNLAKFRLFSRAGLLEATCYLLKPITPRKRRREQCDENDDDDATVTPVKKVQLNDSGYCSPQQKQNTSPALRFHYAYAIGRLQAQIYAQQQRRFTVATTEPTYWRPW